VNQWLHAYLRLEALVLVGTGMMTTEVAEEVAGMETAMTDMMTGAMVTDMMIAAMIGTLILAAKAQLKDCASDASQFVFCCIVTTYSMTAHCTEKYYVVCWTCACSR